MHNMTKSKAPALVTLLGALIIVAAACASRTTSAFATRTHAHRHCHGSNNVWQVVSTQGLCLSASTQHYGRDVSRLSHTLVSAVDTQPFDEIWKADTWTVSSQMNDTRVGDILQKLTSPAPQSFCILERAIQHSTGPPEDVLSQFTYLLKPGCQFQVKDSEWRIVSVQEQNSSWNSVKPNPDCRSVVEIAHEALDKATAASQGQYPVNETRMAALVKEAKDRLELTLGTDIRGRTSADAAFAFALAGVTDNELFCTLAIIATKELERIGKRPSFRSKYVLQVVEKLAACGVRDDDVYQIAADCLFFKREHLDVAKTLSCPGNFDLFSDRPLLWLWRFSAKQTKVASTLPTGATKRATAHSNAQKTVTPEWIARFEHPKLPLVVDVGCGMGVSLLGLATLDSTGRASSTDGKQLDEIDWQNCNFVGGDLNQLSVGYARGIAQRWNVNSKLKFMHGTATELLNDIASHYQGNVALVMIQFPTPFLLKDTGNTQLPVGVERGFMVSESLLKMIARILKRSNGFLLFQSNCEDVAVTMRNMAVELLEFECVPLSFAASDSVTGSRMPQRTLQWLEQGGQRAVGKEWSAVPLLPSNGATETEISCRFSETPIHRCLLRPKRCK